MLQQAAGTCSLSGVRSSFGAANRALQRGVAMLLVCRQNSAVAAAAELGCQAWKIVTITLLLPYDLSLDQWASMDRVFRSTDGWLGYRPEDNTPQWYGNKSAERFVWASVEPDGLLLEGNSEATLWTGWISVLCSRLSLALQMEGRDVEM